MGALGHEASRPGGRRWAVVLVLSAAFHAMVLGAFALRLPAAPYAAGPPVMDVRLAPPFARPVSSPAAATPQSQPTRVVVLETTPRYIAPAEAPTGEAGDAADLFGPVFADGLWPRPMVVRTEPCDPAGEPERGAACRRDLLVIGLASEPPAGSNPRP